MTKLDLSLISEVKQYIANLEHIKEDLNQSNLHDAIRAAEHTLRLARAWLEDLQHAP